MPLDWEKDDGGNVWWAYDSHTAYIIKQEMKNSFTVGYLPAPGPIAIWKKDIESFAMAVEEAEKCSIEVNRIRRDQGYK